MTKKCEWADVDAEISRLKAVAETKDGLNDYETKWRELTITTWADQTSKDAQIAMLRDHNRALKSDIEKLNDIIAHQDREVDNLRKELDYHKKQRGL